MLGGIFISCRQGDKFRRTALCRPQPTLFKAARSSELHCHLLSQPMLVENPVFSARIPGLTLVQTETLLLSHDRGLSCFPLSTVSDLRLPHRRFDPFCPPRLPHPASSISWASLDEAACLPAWPPCGTGSHPSPCHATPASAPNSSVPLPVRNDLTQPELTVNIA